MNPVIILVAPQLGENIGAAARAMKNFGLNELRIVSPRDGWPNLKAIATAVYAADIINNAKIYDDLKDAVSDLNYLYVTTSTPRAMNKEYVLSTDLAKDYTNNKSSVGIMFGRENCGLTNEEMVLANKIITINSDAHFNSLNIAVAVAIVGYELFKTSIIRSDFLNSQTIANKEELLHFFDHLFSELDKKKFFKVQEKRPQMIRNIINIFSRIEKLSKTELQALRGIITTLTR